jgi:hypothetical protein
MNMTEAEFDTPPACCPAFAQALEKGTDNEEYNEAIHFDGESWRIGCYLAPLKFCPWCGATISARP